MHSAHIRLCMPTKEQLAEEVNEILGTELGFEKMRKDDLALLAQLADQGALIEPQMKHMAKKKGNEKLEEQIDGWYPGKYAGKVL